MSRITRYVTAHRKWLTAAGVGLAGFLAYDLGPASKWTVLATVVLTAAGVHVVPNRTGG
jgi:hypothetical protein